MRAILIFYMTKGFLFDDRFASMSYGAYNGLVYATPLIGGMLADRLLGYRRSILLGGILMALGEFTLSFIGFGILPQKVWMFYVGLAIIIAGNGFFKPNISTMVGSLYKQGDPRRDGAFTIFYMGINIGGAVSPLLCGPIGELYGYHYGFGIAGIGMLLGLFSFVTYGRHLGDRGYPPNPQAMRQASVFGIPNGILLYLGILFFVPLGAFLVSRPHIVEAYAAPIAGGAFLLYILWESTRGTKAEAKGIYTIVILTTFSVVFWAFFEQAGSSMNLFTDRHVNRVIFGWEIPASAFQSVNSIIIVLLAPLFAMLWSRLGRAGKNPSSSLKFAMALVQVGLGFFALVLAAKQTAGGAKASLILLLLAYLLHTTGELCLSPVGLSMVTKMAPVRLAGLLMGMWFLSSAFAHILGGSLAAKSADLGYEKLYTYIALAGVASGLVLLLIYPVIKKWELVRLASHHEAHTG
jgi:POT family proton-dependent oligopeptide transporter